MTTSDLDARLDSLVAPPPLKCRACDFLASLDEARRSRLEALLALDGDDYIGSRRIGEALKGLPGAPARDSLDRHRGGHV